MLQEDADVLGGIISGIKPEEQGLIRQPAAKGDGLLHFKKETEPIRGVVPFLF